MNPQQTSTLPTLITCRTTDQRKYRSATSIRDRIKNLSYITGWPPYEVTNKFIN